MKRSLAVVLVLVVAAAVHERAEAGAPFRAFEGDVDPVARGRIDELVLGRLKQLGITPARVCSDGVFVRRAYLDVIGTLPTAEEAAQFLKESGPDKRGKLVDRLLEREEFADYWAMKWCDLLRVKSEFPIKLWPNAVQAYHHWIHASIRENMPYDRFVREMLTASGSNFRCPQVNFYCAVQSREPPAIAQAVALSFMGVRPESWPQPRWSGMAAFFSQIAYKPTVEWKEEIVLFDLENARSPTGMESLRAAGFPDATPVRLAPGVDPRKTFADWLVLDAAGKRLAFNDDHEDKFDDLRTHHADSLIRFTLPADGTYDVRLGDAQGHGGPEHAYRLRLSEPRPDFELRVSPSCIHAITWRLNPFAVYVLRKDGFNGEIALRFKDDPFGIALDGAVVPERQDQIRLTLAIAQLLSADPIRLCLEGRALVNGKEVVHPAVPAEVMTQAFFYKHVVPANDLTLVPEDRERFREEAARAAKQNKPFPPPDSRRGFQSPLEILSEQPVRIPVGGTVEVRVRLGWSRNGQIQVDLSDPPQGITVDRASWTERGLALVLRGDAAKAQPKLKGNLMANAFLQTTVTEKDGKTREARNFIGPLPALPFEIVQP